MKLTSDTGCDRNRKTQRLYKGNCVTTSIVILTLEDKHALNFARARYLPDRAIECSYIANCFFFFLFFLEMYNGLRRTFSHYGNVSVFVR